MTRRQWLAGALTFAAGCQAKSCNDRGGIGPAPPIVSAPSPIGYSNVATLDAREAEAILRTGCTMVQMELTPFDTMPDVRRHLSRAQEVVSVTRSMNAIFFLTLVNWNGASQRAQSDQWFQDSLDAILATIGPVGVWLEGVSEPANSDPKAVRWQRWAVERWPGVTVVNGPGGNGPAAVAGTYLDVHFCDYAKLLDNVRTRSGQIHSTDCSPTLASRLSLAQITEVTTAAVEGRKILMLYDTDNAPSANLAVAETMGAAIRATR